MDRRPDPSKTVQARRQFAEAFDLTMIQIWKDRLRRLRVKDTEALYNSVIRNFPVMSDRKAVSLRYSFSFRYYGIYVDRGTGREVFRGNSGDIGRPKVRRPKRWMRRPYSRSVLNLRDFLAASLAQEAVFIVESVAARSVPT